MKIKEWNIFGHFIRLTRSNWNGLSILSVDGEEIFRGGGYLADFGIAHHFEIDGQNYVAKVEPGLWGYSLQLLTGNEAGQVVEFDGRVGRFRTLSYLISMAVLSIIFAAPLGFLFHYFMNSLQH